MAANSIKSGHSDDQAIVTPEGRLLVSGDGGTQTNPSIGVNDATAPTSSTQIAGQTATGQLTPVLVDSSGKIIVNAGGSMLSADTVESGTVDYAYGDATSVPQAAQVTITSFVAGGPTRLKFVEVSGTNIAQYTVTINGATINKKQTYYGYLDTNFQFSKGLQLNVGDIVTVTGKHNNPDPGEFSAFLLVLKDY